MSRARIAALVLVNWKGVFYERYLLDRHVTALEGANGAGKTTVMIAAYVVLLPDMSKLRFTNLGETSAIGGDRGIWGRLGEPGRPSYAVLDLELADGERLVAGVRLTRAGEPTVEPTAFAITGLAPQVRLSDILLARRLDGDHVPQLDEVAAAVAREGGAIEVFRTIKDYFAALFERGVTPMRLAGDDERGKLNEMLRTSMTGGISRALTSELRGFLLKQETGLGDTLSRMRANLEACRRTRAEVAESRQLEREITAIYEAGAEMFAAAVHAARLTAGEARDRVAAAQPAVDAALATQRDREAEIAGLEQRERELEGRRGGARADLTRVTAERDRRTAACAVTFRIAELDRELAAMTAVAQGARTGQAVATAERQAAKHGREAAREAYDRASLGLAHLQQGLDELVRRAHGHRQLERRLAEARALLGRPDLAVDTAAAALAGLDDRRTRCEAERAQLDRELRDLEARRGEYARALAALAALDPDPGLGAGSGAGALPASAPHDRARAVLARLAERDGLLGRGHELEREHQAAERLASRQHAARALATELGLDARLGTAPATALVATELDATEQAVREAEDEVRDDPAGELRPRIAAQRARLAALDDRLSAWHRAAAAAARLAGFAPAPATRAEATALRDRLLEAQRALAARRAEREATRERTRLRAIALERAGATVDPELIRLRDELGGELLAERFEDLDVAAAGWVEARLGPLVDALIVDDPAGAAQRLAGLPREAATVWLVAAGAALDVSGDPAAPAQLAMLHAGAEATGSASAEAGSGTHVGAGRVGGAEGAGEDGLRGQRTEVRAGTPVARTGTHVGAGGVASAEAAGEGGPRGGRTEVRIATPAARPGTHVGAGGFDPADVGGAEAPDAMADSGPGRPAARPGTHVGAGGVASAETAGEGDEQESTAGRAATPAARPGTHVGAGGVASAETAGEGDEQERTEVRTATPVARTGTHVGAGGVASAETAGEGDEQESTAVRAATPAARTGTHVGAGGFDTADIGGAEAPEAVADSDPGRPAARTGAHVGAGGVATGEAAGEDGPRGERTEVRTATPVARTGTHVGAGGVASAETAGEGDEQERTEVRTATPVARTGTHVGAGGVASAETAGEGDEQERTEVRTATPAARPGTHVGAGGVASAETAGEGDEQESTAVRAATPAARTGTHVGAGGVASAETAGEGDEQESTEVRAATPAARTGTHVGAGGFDTADIGGAEAPEAVADSDPGRPAARTGAHVGAGGVATGEAAGEDGPRGERTEVRTATPVASPGAHVGAGGVATGEGDEQESTAVRAATPAARPGTHVGAGGVASAETAGEGDEPESAEIRAATPVASPGTHVGADGVATAEAAGEDAPRGGSTEAPPRKAGRKRAAGARSSAAAVVDGGSPAVDAVCVEPFGVRVTRRPDPPSLGRRARARQIAELHAQIARDADALDELAGEAARLAGWRRDADELVAQLEAWLAGDPAGERAALESELAAAELALHGCDDRRRAAQARAAGARRRRDGLRRLLGDAALLDPPDHAARAAELSALRGALATARGELERAAPHRRVLAELVDVLRRPPLDDERCAAAAARAGDLAGELDRLFVARGALEDVLAHRHAAAWGDAEQALAAEASLAPALERQHADARAAAQAAEQAEAAVDAAWEAATAAALEADARCGAVAAHRERAATELAALGGPITGAADDHDQRVAAAIEHVNAIEAELRGLVTAAALAAERRDQAVRAAADARTRLTAETRDAGPAAAAWAELRATADAAALLAPALAAAPPTGRTSIQLTADAWSKREVLLDRVTRARGGAELGDAIRALALDGPSYLRAWQLTREWLRHRVPAQVVEVDDPLAALERLRSHLDVLEARLARQEHDLRGASEDVARGIDVQLRRAAGQIRRLNQQLDGIQFGSVRGIRIELRRIDRMEQILRALRLGEAQELLFLSAVPIEEALDEIFRRYGGGRAGGERLLDYREYLELAVQIRRQAAADWETASPTRLSTGEAIGVGAAVMMVVLTEWERDANLLRARRTTGSLRFLFLDEANRLSRDNLGVLFDLCKTLDLQLLIAAPEVARAEGNTTYRLVRHVTDDGREEVIVSGRRAAGPAPPPSEPS